jgi:hypothetical protein
MAQGTDIALALMCGGGWHNDGFRIGYRSQRQLQSWQDRLSCQIDLSAASLEPVSVGICSTDGPNDSIVTHDVIAGATLSLILRGPRSPS